MAITSPNVHPVPTTPYFYKNVANVADPYYRRGILDLYPQGSATLTGIISQFGGESVGDQVYNWFEDRWVPRKVTLRGTNPLTKTAPSTGDADDGTVADTASLSGTLYLKVDTTVDAKAGDQLLVERADSTNKYLLIVQSVTVGSSTASTNGYFTVKFNPNDVPAAFAAADFAADLVYYNVGSAYNTGSLRDEVAYKGIRYPSQLTNYTQIFRDNEEFSGSEFTQRMLWDGIEQTSEYQRRMFRLWQDHMIGIEQTVLFGQRSLTTAQAAYNGVTYPNGNAGRPRYTMDGIRSMLEYWDAGSTGVTVDGSTYAPYRQAQATTDTDSNKRIIENSTGTINFTKFEEWMERITRYRKNQSSEFFGVCGNTALRSINEMVRKQTNRDTEVNTTDYGFRVNTVATIFGNLHLYTHPLFNENPVRRDDLLIMDPNNFMLRPLGDRDTTLLEGQQDSGDDLRIDGFRTELTLHADNIESNIWIDKVTSFSETE